MRLQWLVLTLVAACDDKDGGTGGDDSGGADDPGLDSGEDSGTDPAEEDQGGDGQTESASLVDELDESTGQLTYSYTKAEDYPYKGYYYTYVQYGSVVLQ